MDIDKFYPILWEQNESLVITIPANLVKGLGLKKGDKLKAWIRKVEEEE